MTDYLSLINDISTQSLDTIINNDTSNFLQDEEPSILVDALTRTFAVFTNDPSRVRKRLEEAINVDNQHYWLASTYIEYVDEDNQEFISYPSGFGAVKRR